MDFGFRSKASPLVSQTAVVAMQLEPPRRAKLIGTTSVLSHPIDDLLMELVDPGVASTRSFLQLRKAALPGGKTA